MNRKVVSDGVLTSWWALLSLFCHPSNFHTFVAFIDIQKAFDTSWVEGTLVRLFDAGVGRMWNLLCHVLRGTESQVRLGSSLSVPWADSGIAQGGVFSPLLFNLLINGLIAAVRQVAPGVQLFSSSADSPGQLCADDLELMAESQHDQQVALDAVASWAQTTKSAAMVFGPQRHVPPCSVTLAGTLFAGGFRSFWVGRLVPPSDLSSWSLVGQMLSTSPLVGCCLSLVGCTQCLRATDVHFLL